MSLGFFKAVLKTEFLISALSFLAKILYGKLRLTEMQAETSIGGFSPFKYDLAKKKETIRHQKQNYSESLLRY